MIKDNAPIEPSDDPQRDEPNRAWPRDGGAMWSQNFGAYGQQGVDLSPQNWEKEREIHASKPWASSVKGRLAIRAFARGIIGCTFYAVSNRYASWAMGKAHIDGMDYAGYHPNAPLSESHWKQMPARFTAKLFDICAGKPIQYTVNMLTHDAELAERAVTFRHTNGSYTSGMLRHGRNRGRSLGHEVVGVTFDFASMSVGDGLGQDIAGLFDPSVTKSWLKEGKIDYPQMVRRMMTNTWRYLTYNAGEDWAVALPYVYYVRAQRNLINHFSPGFIYDSDRSLNGGSMKVNDRGEVVGNYNIEGALDLHGRFTAYNVGTLLFREGYLNSYKHLQDWYDKGMPAPKIDTDPESLAQSAWSNVKKFARWVARDTVKGVTYMTPAVPFFWMTRTPQTKYKGLFIHPEKGAVAYFNHGKLDPMRGIQGYHDLVHVNEMRHKHGGDFNPSTPVYFRQFDEQQMRWHGDAHHNPATNQFTAFGFDPYAQTFGHIDRGLNAMGKASNKFRQILHKPVYNMGRRYGYDWNAPLGSDLSGVNKKLVTNVNWYKDLSNTYALAAMSYTPYFFAKTDFFSHLWDNGRTDVAIERAIDGLADFNMNEFKAGCAEYWQSLSGGPLKTPSREAAAQEAIKGDLSPPDVFAPHLLSADRQEQRREQKQFLQQVRTRKKDQGFVQALSSDNPRLAQASFVEKVADQSGVNVPPGATIH